ncbi:hypothetical protein ABFS82_08G007600 [Erythranthe guttata]|uniref:serine/threonine-protein kinase D6PK n=1 Tax=Erythranthe guttata TaxID=4155 RepID=UPI00064D9A0D|nr:PREDICTED: serine/threonine-protein kinase D6PK [Erythranthe guttata]|eukprot:XP_012849905.1 PREDICTED: serine/threonine-protein kinase D6PK [Erythranthe guttata]
MPYDTIEPLAEEVSSINLEYNYSSAHGTSRPPHPRSKKQHTYEARSSRTRVTKAAYSPSSPSIFSKNSYKTPHSVMQNEFDDIRFHQGKEKFRDKDCETEEYDTPNKLGTAKTIDHDDVEICLSYPVLAEGAVVGSLNADLRSKSGPRFCPSPQESFYSATQYIEGKQSFTNTEVSSVRQSCESGEVSNSCDFVVESRKTNSFYRGSSGSDVSDESSSSSSYGSAMYKPHKTNDVRWEAIKLVRSRNNGALELKNFRIFKRLGCGDIGSVHLAELIGTRTCFAMKVMDKEVLAHRKKILRAQTEREILKSLDHPFLPTLYTHFETEKFSFLVMEFCPGGDLHALRQKQRGKFFPEHAARFYLAEVLLALEYLHMLGIIYRDLKPENVLVRQDGHIMLSDFDLSLRCTFSPTLVKSSNPIVESKSSRYSMEPSCANIQTTCFGPRFLGKPKKEKKYRRKTDTNNQVSPLPELIVEPTDARSMSFVGTHEYLAPEIIKGEGHGSAVDWWTFGVFLYELLFGTTPFKGQGNKATLFNVVGQPLRFPESPTVSFAARDLIRGLLVKEPQHRLAYRRGASEIKQHPFFQNVNWALIRCTSPPDVPEPFVMDFDCDRGFRAGAPAPSVVNKVQSGVDVKPSDNYLEIDFF